MALFAPDFDYAPAPGAQYGNNIRTQAKWAPSLASLNFAYQPLEAIMAGANLETSLLGAEGGPRTLDYFTLKNGKPVYQRQTVNTPGSRGLLNLYEQEIQPMLNRLTTSQRQSDISDVASLGLGARKAISDSNPEIAALLKELESQATSELAMGAEMDPSLQRLVSQSIRGRQSGTLLSNGDAGAYDEALKTSQFGQQLRGDRRNFASGVIGLDQSVYGDIFNRILNRSSGASGQGFMGMSGAGAMPSQFHGESQWAAGIEQFNTQQHNTAGIMAQEQWAHMMDQIKGSAMYWQNQPT